MTKHTLVRKIALSGLMLALALIVSLLEGMLPPVVPALPYAKLGLGNVVLLACFVLVGVREGYVVLVLKCLLAAVFQGNVSALVWSLPSAFVAYTAMVLLHRTRLFSVTGLSMAGGMLHNATQIAVAVAVVGKSVVAYLPYMLLAGGIAGFVTGCFVTSCSRSRKEATSPCAPTSCTGECRGKMRGQSSRSAANPSSRSAACPSRRRGKNPSVEKRLGLPWAETGGRRSPHARRNPYGIIPIRRGESENPKSIKKRRVCGAFRLRCFV